MTTEKIIATIKENKERYLNECCHARAKLNDRIKEMTSNQIQQELLFISEMEARSYALFLLFEELEVE